MTWTRRKPVIPDFDLPVTRRTTYVRGAPPGVRRTRRYCPRLSLDSVVALTDSDLDQLREPKYDTEEIEARIASIRREKMLLDAAGRTP